MGLAHTMAKERLFAALRERLGGMETFWGYLVSCPYCLSHWVAFVLVPITGAYFVPVDPRLGWAAGPLRWFLSSVLVVVLAAFLRVVFYFVDETQGLVRKRKRVVETVAQVQEKRAEQQQGLPH
jgi:hypothetical protein